VRPLSLPEASVHCVVVLNVCQAAPASAASFSLIPAQNSSGNYSKVVQVVPVRISIDYGSLPLIVGSSVEANIHVQ